MSDQVTITVQGTDTNPMLNGDSFTVTYHRVQVRSLDFFELEDGMASDMFGVDDSIDGASYEMESTVTVMPPMPSTVSVGPTSVNQGDITDVTVTYTVNEDMLFGTNDVHIGLPRGWAAAYRASSTETTETITSFGDKVLAKEPPRSSDRARTSYVVLTYKFKNPQSTTNPEGTMITGHDPTATTPVFLDIDSTEYDASIDIMVTGGMAKGDTITVTFHNVMVEALEATEPTDASVLVTDSIPGADYASSAMIKVIPPKLGNVTVTPKDPAAESMVDLKIRYTATRVLADGTATYGRIQVQLPAMWGS